MWKFPHDGAESFQHLVNGRQVARAAHKSDGIPSARACRQDQGTDPAWSFQPRAYFHNGSAQSLLDVVRFYEKRFGLVLSLQDELDLVNFLSVL
jgi:cytochrome c peroxidase